jgi:hypothetical protein
VECICWQLKATKQKNKYMKTNKVATVLVGAILVMGALVPAQAQDNKVDPTGTYIWSVPTRNYGPDRTNTLVLKLDGDKLTGDLNATTPGGQITTTKICNGKISGANVSFCVVRSFNGNMVTNKYAGTLTDNVINGTMEYERNGEVQTRDWEAKLTTISPQTSSPPPAAGKSFLDRV